MAYPLQGHIIPTVHLAIKLASNGFTVTFVNTESIHDKAVQASNNQNMFIAARESGLDIRYETVSDGMPVEFDRSLYHDEFMVSVKDKLGEYVEVLARKLIAEEELPITCLVADTFFVWPSTLAKKLNIPYVSFWTEPALVFTLYYHMDLLRQNGHFDSSTGNRRDRIKYIPGVAEIEPTDLPSYLQDIDTSSIVHQIINKAFQEAHDADFIICNTVQELEPDIISAYNFHKPFYAIGPVFPEGFTKSKVPTSLWTESDCTQWLDSKPVGSVLYISFGSYAHVSKKELHNIAYGVMNSKVGFLWVLRPDIVSSEDPDPLPNGFKEETKGRGLLVTWCCQIEVLKHKAVGGFLTHCGWNSILESVWSEVPLLCYPLLTDQFTNRKLVVQDWRIGMDIGGVGSNVTMEDVSKKIKKMMVEEGGSEIRVRVKEIKKILKKAMSLDGSSTRNFQSFVDHLAGYRMT